MSQPSIHRNRSHVLDALRHAASIFAGHRAQVMLLRSVKYLVGTILLLCIADAVVHFTSGTRLGLIITVGLAILGLVIFGLFIACLTRPKNRKMASILEKRHPKLGSKLTNILELHEQAEDPSLASMTRNLAKQAVEDATQNVDTQEIRSIAKSPHRKKEFKRAALILAIFALLPLLLGESGRRQFLRFLEPYGDHPPLSFTWLNISKPSNDEIEIVYGESARIEVTAKGHLPKELILSAEPQDGSGPAREIPMTTRGDGLFITVLENIEQPLRLTASTNNKRSRSKQRLMSVLLNPRIEEAWITVTPPSYTGLSSREKPFRFAGTQALEGSEVSFRLRSNRPLGKGTLQAKLVEGAPLEVALEPVKGEKENEAHATFVATHSGRLHFEIQDEGGRPAESETTSSFTVSYDLPPSVGFNSPTEDSFVVDDHEFEIEVAASDDYGLRTIRLLPTIGEQHLSAITETFPNIGPKRKSLKTTIRLSDLGAKPGDTVTFFAEAIDNCPDPHLSRTQIRRIEVISEEQYQEFLRKQADVSQIAGAYEQVLDRLDSIMARQDSLAKQLEELQATAEKRELTEQEESKLERLQEEQKALNQELTETAQEMREMTEQAPVYDFEESLYEKLAEIAQNIENSVAQTEQSTSNSSSLADSAKAARKQHEKLARQKQVGEEQVRQPLEDLAALHELIKDINEFKALYEEQQELAEQTARFENQAELSPDDRMSLKEMAGRQRQVANGLTDLQEKLRRHADAAEEQFPKASQSARDLADAIGHDNLSDLGRESSHSMLNGEGEKSHTQATHLEEEMAKYISDCANCQSQGQSELDHYLSLSMGSPPGNNFQQMMDSLCFKPGAGQGGSGIGSGGSMATGTMPGQQMGLMGGRALLQGSIGRALAGGSGANGQFGKPGEPLAKVDGSETEKGSTSSTRETSTPDSQALLLEYQDLTDAYFRSLTTSQTESSP